MCEVISPLLPLEEGEESGSLVVQRRAVQRARGTEVGDRLGERVARRTPHHVTGVVTSGVQIISSWGGGDYKNTPLFKRTRGFIIIHPKLCTTNINGLRDYTIFDIMNNPLKSASALTTLYV